MRRVLPLFAAALAFAGSALAQFNVLSCGTVVNGSFTLGASDFYTISSQPGDAITVRLLSTTVGTAFTAQLILLDPLGRTVAPRASTAITAGATLAADYDLPLVPSYQIQVLNASQTAGASYELVFTYLNRACTGASLACGIATQDQIAAALQIKTYQFPVNAGDVASVRWSQIAPFETTTLPNGRTVSFTPLVAVFSPSGTLLTTTTNGNATEAAATGRLDVPAPVSGAVVVMVLEANNLSGNFTISATTLNRPCGSGTLNCGAVTQSSISAPLNVVTYGVAMAAGDLGAIRTASTATGTSMIPYLELYGPSGNAVPVNVSVVPSSHAVVNFTFNIQTAGNYNVLVRDGTSAGTGTGGFAATLIRFNRPCSTTVSLTCSSVADGSISGILGTNIYTLSANANDVYLLRLLHTDQNALFHPRVDIYDSQGNSVASVIATSLTRQTLTLPTTNVYTLVVSDGYDGTQSGTYTLSTLRLNRPCNTGALSCGAVAPGSFSRPLAAGVYSYSANAGESFSVRMFDLTGALQPDLEVYDPSGNPAGQNISASYTGVDVVRPVAGAYAIVALDNSPHPAGGPFAVDLLRTVNACAVPAPQGQTVGGVITAVVPFVSYSVPTSAGDSLLVRSASSSPGFAAQMELYDPTGTRVDSETFAVSRPNAAAGNYTVIVGAAAPLTGGGYTLSWQLLNNPVGVSPLSCGGSVAAPLAASNQFQYYAAAANAGDVLRLLLTKLSANFSPQMDLYDPTGAHLTSSLTITQPANAAGNYLVVVSPSNPAAQTGSYSLAFQRPNSPCSPATLTCGQTTLRQVTAPAQLDTYLFNGTGGDRADIKLVQRSGGYTPLAELYDSSGNLLASTSGGTILATLSTTGAYALLVRDSMGTTLGSYRVSLQDDTHACLVNDTQPPTISLLEPTGGEVIGGGTAYYIQWLSDDNVGVTTQSIALSTDGGQTFPTAIASGLSGTTQSYGWQVPPGIAPTRTAVIRVTAADAAGNAASASSGPLTLIGSGFTPNSTATYSYDSLNRRVQAALSDGRTVTYTWDAAGNLIGVTISQ